ncbi:MAG: radical SAM protein [Candidatus Thermoplasmatota archaeon]
MEIVYGPVPSWRLGKSLGIDLINSTKKICSFNCSYCQIQNTEYKTKDRKEFVDIKQMRNELIKALNKAKPDVITFSGTGEPTLAKNLNQAISEIKKNTEKPIAILTNSTLLYRKEVRADLKHLDIIVAKLDVPNPHLFNLINRPVQGIGFENTIKGIKEMKKSFDGKFCLQIMFIEKNKDYAKALADITDEINPDEIQINTPLRPCKEKPLSLKEMKKILEKFGRKKSKMLYYSHKKNVDSSKVS